MRFFLVLSFFFRLRTPWPLDVPERLIKIEARRRLEAVFLSSILTSLLLPPLKVDAATGIICTACHCASYFPKDYCLWPLPLGQSWYHSGSPWLQRLTGRCGGNHHSPSFLFYENERIFSPAITPLAASHFFPFLSPLCPTPIKLHGKARSTTTQRRLNDVQKKKNKNQSKPSLWVKLLRSFAKENLTSCNSECK